MKCERIPAGFRPRTLLVVRDSRVGDVLLTTPAIRRLKERYPEAALDVLTSRYARHSGVLARNPHVRRVLTCPRNTVLRWLRCVLLPRYDLVVPIRRRRAFAWIRSTLTVTGSLPARSPHVVHRAEAALGFPVDDRFVPLEIHPTAAETARAAREVPRPAVGIYPCCHASTVRRRQAEPMSSRRVWRAAEVKAAVHALLSAGHPVILLGGRGGEGRTLEALDLGVPILAGGSITLLAARLARLRALVTVDTGPMHVAAAMDVPIVALYGPTRPEVTGPYSRPGRAIVLQDRALPCSPCRGRQVPCRDNVCMTYHTPERLLAALDSLTGPRGRPAGEGRNRASGGADWC